MPSPNDVTGLREDARSRLEQRSRRDVLIGIPAFNNDRTVRRVMEKAAEGLHRHHPELQGLVMLSDGGSLDDTREEGQNASLPDSVDRLVTIYRGLAGKGSAFRAIFEAASVLDVDYCLVLDSDLRSEVAGWVPRHLDPLLNDEMDFLAPRYVRHKFDGTITNNVCYPLTAALYGVNIRQPIGGDFALSGDLVRYYARQQEWDTDVARFGVDIWMTTTAVCEGFRVGQTNLGAKIHDPKDPGESLGPMFRQVVGTLFRMMGRYEQEWQHVETIEDAPTFGSPVHVDPEPVAVNRDGLRSRAYAGWRHHRDLYPDLLSEGSLRAVREAMGTQASSDEPCAISARLWARVLYDHAIAYQNHGGARENVLDALVPLYFARTAQLFDEMDGMDDEESEQHIRRLANLYQDEKPYLETRWAEGVS